MKAPQCYVIRTLPVLLAYEYGRAELFRSLGYCGEI